MIKIELLASGLWRVTIGKQTYRFDHIDNMLAFVRIACTEGWIKPLP